ncbi:hypothetical protein CT0861_03187 [Colletotrichum tofieldiae]|uniref:Uncharacterized protein n=1 Tax=Colletotrichum tofieldiae TaxID=708197 RepID=A0A166RLK3_9PEZI|nr:hypothetical protein CT0861_03187 [Colletotrichum tofieldiae]
MAPLRERDDDGGGGGPDAALHAVHGVITGMTGLANWKSRETSQSIRQWEWMRTAEAAWQLE